MINHANAGKRDNVDLFKAGSFRNITGIWLTHLFSKKRAPKEALFLTNYRTKTTIANSVVTRIYERDWLLDCSVKFFLITRSYRVHGSAPSLGHPNYRGFRPRWRTYRIF